jgi:hypothetical protein
MSAIELLGDSISQKHGRAFTAEQCAEIGETLQALQTTLIDRQMRLDALVQLTAAAITELGGTLEITPSTYEAVEGSQLEVNWQEEGVIHVKVDKMEMSSVREDGDSAERLEDTGVAPVPAEEPTEAELADGADGER